jgi:hypothetical protein
MNGGLLNFLTDRLRLPRCQAGNIGLFIVVLAVLESFVVYKTVQWRRK